MIDKNKQYRTRDGREVRIYATDGVGTHTVHGAIKTEQGWRSQLWRDDGYFVPYATDNDLIEVKPRIKREIWVNVYPHRMGVPHGNKAYVDAHRGKDAIACVKLTIDCEEGEGL